MVDGSDPRRRVPATDAVLADPLLADALERLDREVVKAAVRDAQQQVRQGLLAPEAVAQQVAATLRPTSIRSVLNATGVVLHTNLGRAPLAPEAVTAIEAAAGYCDVEFDLAEGSRARRGRGALAALAAAVPAAEDVLVVNNGAAALLLAVTTLAAGREVLVSRGELIEIGDGFRLPDLIQSTGVRIREVGTTNRTYLRDYTAAIEADRDGRIAAIVKLHPSNFAMGGFVASASVRDLAGLGLPLIVDTGSGLLHPDPLLPDEPDATTALREGAHVVTTSGDKLLGGPQAGLLLGSADLLGRMRRHPMARALRTDKITLAALEASLRVRTTPTYEALHADPEVLRRRAKRLADLLGAPAEVVASDGAVGGGGAPLQPLPGWAVAVPAELAQPLRTAHPPVVGRVEDGRLLLDLRAVPADADDTLLAALQDALSTVKDRLPCT
jgi:L-seryl-tRNA(Ser) seleniumtransferase